MNQYSQNRNPTGIYVSRSQSMPLIWTEHATMTLLWYLCPPVLSIDSNHCIDQKLIIPSTRRYPDSVMMCKDFTIVPDKGFLIVADEFIWLPSRRTLVPDLKCWCFGECAPPRVNLRITCSAFLENRYINLDNRTIRWQASLSLRRQAKCCVMNRFNRWKLCIKDKASFWREELSQHQPEQKFQQFKICDGGHRGEVSQLPLPETQCVKIPPGQAMNCDRSRLIQAPDSIRL